jgi:hemolysin activation/secretion protein
MKLSALCVLLLLSSAALAQHCKDGRTPIQIAKIDFELTPGLTPELRQAITENIKAHNTDGCETSNEMAERARDLLQQRGYFKAHVQDPRWKIVGNSGRSELELFLVIELGEIYRLAHIGFRDTPFGADELRTAVPLADGEIFNVEKVRQGLKNLRDLYHSHGYTNFTPVPNTEVDDEHRLITLTFDLSDIG